MKKKTTKLKTKTAEATGKKNLPPAAKKVKPLPTKKAKAKPGSKDSKLLPIPTDLLATDGGRAILSSILNDVRNHQDGARGAIGHGKRSAFFKDFVENQGKQSHATGSKGVLCGYKPVKANVLQERFGKSESRLKIYIEEMHSAEDGDKGETVPDDQAILLTKYTAIHEMLKAVPGPSQKAKDAAARKKVMETSVIGVSARPQVGPDTAVPPGKPQKKRKTNSSRYGGVNNRDMVLASSTNARKVSSDDSDGMARSTPEESVSTMANCVVTILKTDMAEKKMDREQQQLEMKYNRVLAYVNDLKEEIKEATRDGDDEKVAELKAKKEKWDLKRENLLERMDV